uniref:Uncharacterized protein n=1 Tax=Cacopsylla melanoneura TaxID=428564 RepID=A0A8D8PRH4_9HEMI
MEKTPVNKLRCLPKEFDPRSPTIDFNRTPIMVVDSPSSYGSSTSQNVSFKSVLDESYDSFDLNLSREDPSPIVSQLSLEIETSCNLDTECDSNSQDTNQISPDNYTVDSKPKLISIITEEPKKQAPSTPGVESPQVENITSAKVSEKAAPAAKKIIFSPSMAKNCSNKMVTSSPCKVNTSFTCHMDDENMADQGSPQQSKVCERKDFHWFGYIVPFCFTQIFINVNTTTILL